MSKKLDLRGMRFGRLTVIEEAGRATSGRVLWRCKCDCGNETVASSSALRCGVTVSCGCFKRDRLTKHGLRRHPMYDVWRAMMKRTGVWKCSDGKDRRNYIERGISICDEWKTFENFYNWSIEHGYSKGLQIDRIDNDGDYEPGNCRWVTQKKNCNNRRNTHRLSDGTPLAEFASSFGIGTTCRTDSSANAYKRVLYAFKNHGEQFATMLVFDIALEQIANKAGFTYCKNAIVHI